jgi:hypothetical protein
LFERVGFYADISNGSPTSATCMANIPRGCGWAVELVVEVVCVVDEDRGNSRMGCLCSTSKPAARLAYKQTGPIPSCGGLSARFD